MKVRQNKDEQLISITPAAKRLGWETGDRLTWKVSGNQLLILNMERE